MCLICANINCMIMLNNINAYTFGETWIVVGPQHVLEWGVGGGCMEVFWDTDLEINWEWQLGLPRHHP